MTTQLVFLLDFAYFKENYRLIAFDQSKQAKLKDPQQIIFICKLEEQANESKGSYSHHNPRIFLIKSIESSYCYYSDAYILVTRNIAVTRVIAAAGNNPIQKNKALTAATQVAYKNCAPFKDCRTEISDSFVDYANFNNITMSMCNLIEF